jgi:hypothetical protein
MVGVAIVVAVGTEAWTIADGVVAGAHEISRSNEDSSERRIKRWDITIMDVL